MIIFFFNNSLYEPNSFNFPCLHNINPVTIFNGRKAMSDHQESIPILHIIHIPHNSIFCFCVQSTGALIQHQNARSTKNCPSNSNTLALPPLNLAPRSPNWVDSPPVKLVVKVDNSETSIALKICASEASISDKPKAMFAFKSSSSNTMS